MGEPARPGLPGLLARANSEASTSSAVNLSNSNQTDAPITSVVVYVDHAVITRTWTKKLNPGIHHIRFTNFYQQYLSNSLRVEISGPANLTDIVESNSLTSSDREAPKSQLPSPSDSLPSNSDPKLNELLKQKHDAEIQLHFAEKRLEIWESYRQVVMGKSQSPPENIFKEGAFADMHDFLWKYEGEFVRLHTLMDQTRLALRTIQLDIVRHQSGLGSIFCKVSDIKIVIHALDMGPSDRTPVRLDITYAVTEVNWTPQYIIRIVGKTAQVAYSAYIRQTTGEDWTDVSLSAACTARTLADTLTFTEVDAGLETINGPVEDMYSSGATRTGSPAHSVRQDTGRSRTESGESQLTQAGLALTMRNGLNPPAIHRFDQSLPVAQGSTRRSRNGFAIALPEKVSVAHDRPVQCLLRSLQYDCVFKYKCEPLLEQAVQRKAHFANTSNVTVLSGTASLYVEGNYAGTRTLKTVGPLEELTLSLGIDKDLEVTVKTPSKTTKPLTTNMNEGNYNVEAEFTQEFEIKNNKKAPVSVDVTTAFPISQDPRVKVTVVHPRPKAQVQPKVPPKEGSVKEKSEAKQTIDIPPGTARTVSSMYKVEHPHNSPFSALPR